MQIVPLRFCHIGRDPAGGAHDAPTEPLIGWPGGDTLPSPYPEPNQPHLAPTHLRHLPCVPQNSSQIYTYVCTVQTTNSATEVF